MKLCPSIQLALTGSASALYPTRAQWDDGYVRVTYSDGSERSYECKQLPPSYQQNTVCGPGALRLIHLGMYEYLETVSGERYGLTFETVT